MQGYNRERIISTGFRTGEASVGSGDLGGAHGGFAGSPGSVSWAGWWVHRSLWYCYSLSLIHILSYACTYCLILKSKYGGGGH